MTAKTEARKRAHYGFGIGDRVRVTYEDGFRRFGRAVKIGRKLIHVEFSDGVEKFAPSQVSRRS